jgi:hypothetical protein
MENIQYEFSFERVFRDLAAKKDSDIKLNEIKKETIIWDDETGDPDTGKVSSYIYKPLEDEKKILGEVSDITRFVISPVIDSNTISKMLLGTNETGTMIYAHLENNSDSDFSKELFLFNNGSMSVSATRNLTDPFKKTIYVVSIDNLIDEGVLDLSNAKIKRSGLETTYQKGASTKTQNFFGDIVDEEGYKAVFKYVNNFVFRYEKEKLIKKQ